MQKQRRHHPRIKRRLTQSARVTAGDRGKIKLFPDKGHDQPRQMVLRHIVLHARRQKLRLINLPTPKIFAHSHAKNQTHSNLTSDYSDRLLGTLSWRSRVWRLQAGFVIPSQEARSPAAPDEGAAFSGCDSSDEGRRKCRLDNVSGLSPSVRRRSPVASSKIAAVERRRARLPVTRQAAPSKVPDQDVAPKTGLLSLMFE